MKCLGLDSSDDFQKKIFTTTTLTKTKNNNKQVGIGFGSFFFSFKNFFKQKKSKVAVLSLLIFLGFNKK